MSFVIPFVRMAAAAALTAFRQQRFESALRQRVYGGPYYGGYKHVTTNWKAKLKGQTNGARECARRVRQIAGGQHGYAR